MEEKLFISAQQFLEDSVSLAYKVVDSGYKPNFIVALWRGGTFPGCVMQELLEYHGIENDHIAIRTSGRNNDQTKKKEIKVYGLHYLVEQLKKEDRLLIVDDVYDSGLSIKALIDTLKEKTGKNYPHEVRVATVFYKPEKNETNRKPDYFVHETDRWLVFPHEFIDLSRAEIEKSKGKKIAKMMRE
jgi:hypoxanthine phosphoribosyltransferase